MYLYKLFDYIQKYLYIKKDNEQLYDRMKFFIENDQTYYKNNKFYIITVKSNDLINQINTIDNISDKTQYIEKVNNTLIKTSEEAYNKFSPTLIYTCNNEINFVFYPDNFIYNGNISKITSNITSYVTCIFNKNFTEDYIFHAYSVQIKDDSETFNYIIWRYLDCIRNVSNLLWKCSQKSKDVLLNPNVPTLDVVQRDIQNYTKNIKYLYGCVLKKYKHTVIKNDQEYTRNSIQKLLPKEIFEKDFLNNLDLINFKIL